uniref:uncharacterized protein LOC120338769 n=1 Tax=Styela clava TaxID=7725 RepID=UPI001939C617|nr:uncharacterized protein LOC120338769 [Styela clava]
MKTMHRQADFNFGLESKGITKRLRDNLERSAQADASIKKIKCSMPNCTTKYHKGRNFAKTLMKVWSDEDAGNTTAMSEEVTIPACINLLRSAGFEIDKSLSRKLDEMRKAQLQIQKMRNARKSRDGQRFNARSKSLPRFNNGRLTSCGNETQWDYINPFESQSTHFPLIQNGEREDLLSSSSSTSSCDILKNGHRRLRSDTQPGKLNRSKRPYSAPDLETKVSSVVQKCTIEPHIIEDEIMETQETIVEDCSNDNAVPKPFTRTASASSFRSDDVRAYGEEVSYNQCPLQRLHKKIHTNPEDVNLLDLHRATIASRNYPRRMKTFIRGIHEWQIPEDDKVDGLTGDYYSFRIQKKTGSCTSQGEGRRATSARSYKSRYSTDEFNGVKLCKDTEEEYYEKALKTSTTDLRHKSMTIKPLSTVWGSSEYIECIL